MANAKITKQMVERSMPTEKAYFLWDCDVNGFGLKVTPVSARYPNGQRVYALQYRNGGRETVTQRYTIGKHGNPWTPNTAREEALRLLTLARQGHDPRAAQRRKKSAAITLAFEDYVEFFTDNYLKASWPDTWQEAKRRLDRDIVPVFRRKPLPELRKADIVSLLNTMNDRPATKRATYAILSKLFNWACEEQDDLTDSPMAKMKAPPAVPARDRFLTAEEFACVLLAAKATPYPYGPLVELMTSTLQRRENVATFAWQEIQFDACQWHIPKEKMKKDDAHICYLSNVSLNILGGLERKRAGLVFTTTGKTAFSGFSKAKAALDLRAIAVMRQRAVDRGELVTDIDDHVLFPPWRIHDLRRTAATFLQAMGVPVEITEELLSHKSGTRAGVVGVYNKYKYLPEKTIALQILGEFIEEVLRSSNASAPQRSWIFAERLKAVAARP